VITLADTVITLADTVITGNATGKPWQPSNRTLI
jgi:hypothetical protein